VGLQVAAALLAFGGFRLGIGADVAGSVRIPAHYSGIYTIKASAQRFPKDGNNTTVVGQEGIPAVYSPMTRTLDDLETFWRAIVGMKPWEYDHSVCQCSLLISGGYHWCPAVRSYTLANSQSP
jgi:Asp-tRNA(Asn)/Glu-tRNA(Gln) amidotransferase A subunit family amidase